MKEFDKDLQAKVENHLKTTGMSANDLGRAIELSGSTISQYRNSTYIGDVAKIEKKLKDYFCNIEESKRLRKTGGYVETSISKVFTKQSVCVMCRAVWQLRQAMQE